MAETVLSSTRVTTISIPAAVTGGSESSPSKNCDRTSTVPPAHCDTGETAKLGGGTGALGSEASLQAARTRRRGKEYETRTRTSFCYGG